MDLRIGRTAVALLCASLALAAAAGMSLLLAPDTTVTGRVTGFGWTGDGRCYPTVEYVVDGETYRTTPRKDERWCAYDPDRSGKPGKRGKPEKSGRPPEVYVSSADPEDGRLSKYGDTPPRLAVGAIVTFFAGVLSAVRRRQHLGSLRSTG